MFKYTEICHKMRKAWFYQNRKEKVLITILYAKAFLYASFPCSARSLCVCWSSEPLSSTDTRRVMFRDWGGGGIYA